MLNETSEEHVDWNLSTLKAGILSLLVESCINSGLCYEEFCQELDKAKNFYKGYWDEMDKR